MARIAKGKKGILTPFLIIFGSISCVVVIMVILSFAIIGAVAYTAKESESEEAGNLVNITIKGLYDGKGGTLKITGQGISIDKIKGSQGTKNGFKAKTKKGKIGKRVKAEYTSYYPGDGGFMTASGIDTRTCIKKNIPMVAAPKSLPFDTKITPQGTGTSIDGVSHLVKDRGGAIVIFGDNRYRFDVLKKNAMESLKFGRRRGYAIIGGSQSAELDVSIDKKKRVTITGEANGDEVYAEGTWDGKKIDASGWLGDGASSAADNGGGEGVSAAVDWAVKISKGRNDVGYSQANRTCYICHHLKNKDYDCSSFVTAALAHGGNFEIFKKACKSYPYTTLNMGPALKKSGFKNLGKIPVSKLKKGDVLLNPSAHVELCAGKVGGHMVSVGAHADRDGRPGESSSDEVYRTRGYCMSSYTQVWRHK